MCAISPGNFYTYLHFATYEQEIEIEQEIGSMENVSSI